MPTFYQTAVMYFVSHYKIFGYLCYVLLKVKWLLVLLVLDLLSFDIILLKTDQLNVAFVALFIMTQILIANKCKKIRYVITAWYFKCKQLHTIGIVKSACCL